MAGSVLDICNCCRKGREEEGLAPRRLERLPLEITNHKLFKRKGQAVKVCLNCDGDAYPRAIRAQERRYE